MAKIVEFANQISEKNLKRNIDLIREFFPGSYAFYFDKNYKADLHLKTTIYEGKSISRESFTKDLLELTGTENVNGAIQAIYTQHKANKESESDNASEQENLESNMPGEKRLEEMVERFEKQGKSSEKTRERQKADGRR